MVEEQEKVQRWIDDFEKVRHLLPRRVEKMMVSLGAKNLDADKGILPRGHLAFIQSLESPPTDSEILEIADKSGVDISSGQDLLEWLKSSLRIALEMIVTKKGKPTGYEFIRRLKGRDSNFVAKKVMEEFGIKKRTRVRKWPEHIIKLEKELEEIKAIETVTQDQIKERNALYYQMDEKKNPVMPYKERTEFGEQTLILESIMKRKRYKIRDLKNRIAIEKAKYRLNTEEK